MMTRGAQLRLRLPEPTESTSSSSIGIFISRIFPSPNEMVAITNIIDVATSNFESPSSTQQLTSTSKSLSDEISNEDFRIEAEDLRHAISQEGEGGASIRRSKALLDHKLLTMENYYYSDTTATEDYYQDLNVTEDYYDDLNMKDDYYQDLNVTDGYDLYPAVTDDYYHSLNVTDDYYQNPNSTDDYYDILRSKPFIDLQMRFSAILGTLRNWETPCPNRGFEEVHSELSP